ncbi:amidohydrolase [Shewanella sedimentimangrovi]|uniref:Amidohydrolase n=1 Tax=Shewanella sedimentimangrovi TaxID=2814293 RepID=A0ABX7R261_9GAMM|nr:amidohydrolase [Shewanella sedimentimangrovi]QSX37794.1 amidohydrolase [Shewanella sedimentimangrovi]
MKQTKSGRLLQGLMLGGLITLSACASDELADTIITNASIYGYDTADSLAIRDGKIVEIGSKTRVMEYASPRTQLLDLEGAFLMPGFIDNHNHVFEAASDIGSDCLLDKDRDLDAYIRRLRSCKAGLAPDEWLLGYGHELSVLLSDDKTSPLQLLDELFPDNPVIIMEQTSHSMWVNSRALAKAGINAHSQDPQGGKYLKDKQSGELLGVLLDNAGDRLMELAWQAQPNLRQANYRGLMNGLAEAAAHGITTIGDGRLYWKRGWLDTWLEAEQKGELSARVSLRPWVYPDVDPAEQLAFFSKIHSDDTNRRLLINQVKLYSDGIIVNGTASTLAPYDWSYTPELPYGLEYIAADKMAWWLTELDKLGYGAHIHAIGDAGARNTLNAIATLRARGVSRPYGMTHLEMIDKADIQRFAQLDVDADFQLGSDYIAAQDHSWAEPFIGKNRAHALLPINPVFESGANVTLSSDWNVNDINPLVGIANAVYLQQAGLGDVHAAIAAYTINAARALGIETITGSLSLGKSADLVVLERDITHLAPEQIANTKILMTLLEGEVVFDMDN